MKSDKNGTKNNRDMCEIKFEENKREQTSKMAFDIYYFLWFQARLNFVIF